MWTFITDNLIMNDNGFGISWRVATFILAFVLLAKPWLGKKTSNKVGE